MPPQAQRTSSLDLDLCAQPSSSVKSPPHATTLHPALAASVLTIGKESWPSMVLDFYSPISSVDPSFPLLSLLVPCLQTNVNNTERLSDDEIEDIKERWASFFLDYSKPFVS